MVDVMGLADIPIPNFGIGTGIVPVVMAIFLFFLVGAIIIFVIYSKKVYKYKIIIFENISGQGYQPTIRDRARTIEFGEGGEELLFLRKTKKYRTAYGRKMGKNTYWFVIGQDGYWYNSVLGDLDAKLGMLDIEPIDRDLRLMHVAIRKMIQDRYKKPKFMEKYGPIVIISGFTLIMIIGIWFLLDKMADINAASSAAIQVSKEVMEGNREVLTALNNILEGGSGIRPTGG